MPWPTAAKKGGKWYIRGSSKAADCLMARWHRTEARRGEMVAPREAEDNKKAATWGRGRKGGGGGGSDAVVEEWANTLN